MLLISDEVICGFGRLGTDFGCQRFGVTPDLMTCAKGLTSGYVPMGAVVVSDRVKEPFFAEGSGEMFRHGYTYGGHPAAAAAGLANLEIIEREGLVERVRELEPVLAEAYQERFDGHPMVAEVRSIGLAAAVEFTPEALAATPRPGRRRRRPARSSTASSVAACAASRCRSRRRSSSPRTRSPRWPGACAWPSTTPCGSLRALPEGRTCG